MTYRYNPYIKYIKDDTYHDALLSENLNRRLKGVEKIVVMLEFIDDRKQITSSDTVVTVMFPTEGTTDLLKGLIMLIKHLSHVKEEE